MKAILSAEEMRSCDQATIEKHKVPSLVLMERAAGAVANFILEKYPDAYRICVLCGPGNNGGDGVAIARLLHLAGLEVHAILMGNPEKYSAQLSQEIEIAKTYGVNMSNVLDKKDIEADDLFVDAMFGIGLTRGLEGEYLQAALAINGANKPVVAVDIPSGYDTDCGKLLGEGAVKATDTVTFAYMKKGLTLGECKVAAGNIHVADVGIYLDDASDKAMLLEEADLKKIPKRSATANKGTCKKILVIAGSENIYGACYLSAKAALKTGSGLVKIFTHKNNILSIQQALPEAMYFGFEDFQKEKLLAAINWAEVILMGPGLGTGDVSKEIVATVFENAKLPLVIDADGINICAQNIEQLKSYATKYPVILTPHLKEMERLSGVPVLEINYNMENVAKKVSKETAATVALKNFTSITVSNDRVFYSTSGNEALATPGSGDVLAGIITGLLAQGLSTADSTALGVFFHGLCGKYASEKVGIKAVLATDIIEEIKMINVLT